MKTFKEFINENISDYLQPKPEEEIKKISHLDGFVINISDGGYTEKQAKNLIKKYSKKLNSSFKDDSKHRPAVDWLYEWGNPYNSISLNLSSYDGKFHISFNDTRNRSLKKFIDEIKNPNSMDYSRYQFMKEFYLLDNALKFLTDCGIDVSEIKEQHLNENFKNLLKGKSEEEIKNISHLDGDIVHNPSDYTVDEVKGIIRQYSNEFNKSFRDDTNHEDTIVVDWLYKWNYNSINLTFYYVVNKYFITFYDDRKNAPKRNIPQYSNGILKYTFTIGYYLLDNALKFLTDCGIDVSKIKEEHLNENLKNLLKGKSDEDVRKGLEELSNLDKIRYIKRYDINHKFLPPDENIKKVLDKLNFLNRPYFIERYKLPIRFMPSDEEIEKELDKLSYQERMEKINMYKLLDKFLPKRAKTQRLEIIQKIYKIIKQIGPFNEFVTTYILDQFIKDDRYDAILLQEIRHDGILYYGYLNTVPHPNNFINYENMNYNAVNFIMKRVIKDQIKNGRIKLNESVTDLLKPKSNEEILKSLGKLSNDDQIVEIILNELPFELLPRNEEGRCIFNDKLNISHYQIKELPDNLTINGFFNCSNNDLKKLPKGLIVKKHLKCTDNQLTEIPDDLKVGGQIDCRNNRISKLPDNFTVGTSLLCNNNYITKLPKGLKVKKHLYCIDNSISEIPDDIQVGGSLSIGKNNITSIPVNFHKKIKKGLCIDGNNVNVILPDNLRINGNFNCEHCNLYKLPENLFVKENLFCGYNNLTELPKGLVVGDELFDFQGNNKPKLEIPEDAKIGEIFWSDDFLDESIKNILQPKVIDNVEEILKGMDKNDQIEAIIRYGFDFNLLPRDEDGYCVFDGGYLDLRNQYLTKLPDKFTAKYILNLGYNKLKELPDNLTVGNDLFCHGNKLTKLPKNLWVGGSLYCYDNEFKLEKPNDAYVGRQFYNYNPFRNKYED